MVITVASKKAVATIWKRRQRLEATVYGDVATVAAVAGVFEITGTLDHEQLGRGGAMSLLSSLLDNIPPSITAAAKPTMKNPPTDHPRRLVLVERTPEIPATTYTNAASATPEWRQARDQYLSHIMICRSCYAPAARYCLDGADLRASYDSTPMNSPQKPDG